MNVAVAAIKNTATAMAEAKIYILTTGLLFDEGVLTVVGGSAIVITPMGVAVDVVSVRAGVVMSMGVVVGVVTFVTAVVVAGIVGAGVVDVVITVVVVVGAGVTALTP
jgi:hypothetical protein